MPYEKQKILKYHSDFSRELEFNLRAPFKIEQIRGSDDWKKIEIGGQIEFALIPTGKDTIYKELRGLNNSRHIAFNIDAKSVNRLRYLWASWRETWEVYKKKRKLNLLSPVMLSWTFFLESEDSERKHQIFRAEWDSEKYGNKYVHPHWHVDRSFIIMEDKDDIGAYPMLTQPKLEKTYNLSKMHFGMGSKIDGINMDLESYWNHKLDNLAVIKKWAVNTLLICRKEFESFRTSVSE